MVNNEEYGIGDSKLNIEVYVEIMGFVLLNLLMPERSLDRSVFWTPS